MADKSRYAWVSLILALAAVSCTGGGQGPTPEPVTRAPEPTATAAPPPSTPRAVPTPSPAPAATPPDATPTPGAPPLTALGVERAFPGLSFTRMVALVDPDDGTGRLFLVLQAGAIMVFPDDQDASSAGVFLDIRPRVNDRGNEEGLLGLAFDPDYGSSGYFYVYYSASNPRRSVVSRFSVSASDPDSADPDSERIVLEVPQPYSNHNGGQIVFGPDGRLYIGLGDGGSRNDPHGNGQDLSTLLGSILRIDVSGLDDVGVYSIPAGNPFAGGDAGARGEIWAYGLRNPWRFTFDRLTGDLWAGDVGQNRYEEIDVVRPGVNYGWNVMEGDECFRPMEGCDRTGLEQPIAVYGRDGGCSVTGGYVYRGARLPSLYGAYVYGDFCSGKIWALRYEDGAVTEHIELVDSGLSISSFGEDRHGELYILSFDDRIYRFVSR